MTREEKAVYYKHNGFNCCQSVIKAMIDLSDSDKEILTNAASGFAAGMGGMEATCGALIGATMMAGIELLHSTFFQISILNKRTNDIMYQPICPGCFHLHFYNIYTGQCLLAVPENIHHLFFTFCQFLHFLLLPFLPSFIQTILFSS